MNNPAQIEREMHLMRLAIEGSTLAARVSGYFGHALSSGSIPEHHRISIASIVEDAKAVLATPLFPESRVGLDPGAGTRQQGEQT